MEGTGAIKINLGLVTRATSDITAFDSKQSIVFSFKYNPYPVPSNIAMTWQPPGTVGIIAEVVTEVDGAVNSC